MNIDGVNGLACQTKLDDLPEKIVIRPLPGMPVIRDLVVDQEQFFEQYRKINPYVVAETEDGATKEHIQLPEQRDQLDGLYSVSYVLAVRLHVLPIGGIRISLSVLLACWLRAASFWIQGIQKQKNG